MQAVGVIPDRRDIRIVEHAPARLAADDEVRIRSLDVGLCGTDEEIASFVYGAPPPGCEYLVIGHENLGEVVETGTKVSRFKPGDLVVPSVRRPCDHDHCRPCRTGRQDFCATGDFTERGIKMRHGFLTEYYVEREAYLTPVPAELRDVGVLVEPLTVAEKGLTQVSEIQKRLPWAASSDPQTLGTGLRAVVLGAGPVGILGAMALLSRGFETWVYSRSPKPNRKADLVETIGAQYISSKTSTPEELAERVGSIDLIYEAAGSASAAFGLLPVLGVNGIAILTGIPGPKPPMELDASRLMRHLVLRNQAVVGTVNADLRDFQRAADDLSVFSRRWPDALGALITGRHPMASTRELLLGEHDGIKDVIALG
jgi:threonine dehydrogenase-like Zn-dependent dehydrogenase